MSQTKSIVCTDAETGRVYLRNGIVLAYFIDRPVHEICSSLLGFIDAYRQSVPGDALKWAVPSATAEAWRPLDDATLARCKALLTPEGAKKRRLTAFHFSDSGAAAPRYSFDLVGKVRGAGFPKAQSLVQACFPIEEVEDGKVEDFVARIRGLSQQLPFSYGYCSPALLYSALHPYQAYTDMRELVIRHPGYDVHNNQMAALTIDGMTRGARWISLIGPDTLSRLGGDALAEQQLEAPLTVERVGAGTMIRAGRVPEIGDGDSRDGTPLLRKLAKFLEPVTLFGETDLIFTNFDDDETFLSRWERRFLD